MHTGQLRLRSGAMNHASFTTSSRQVIGVILETTYFEDVSTLIRTWADKYQFVFENTESNLGPIFKLSRGINRQKFIKHEIKLKNRSIKD
jgi:hypothetical protein